MHFVARSAANPRLIVQLRIAIPYTQNEVVGGGCAEPSTLPACFLRPLPSASTFNSAWALPGCVEIVDQHKRPCGHLLHLACTTNRTDGKHKRGRPLANPARTVVGDRTQISYSMRVSPSVYTRRAYG